jgi:Transglycosylase SLT domain
VAVNPFHDALLQRLTTIDSMGVDATNAFRQRMAAQAAAQAQQQQSYMAPTPSYGGSSAGYSSGAAKPGNNFNNFLNAIVAQESGGRYNAVGVPVRGDRAYGKYQIMGNNIPSWTRAATGRSYTPQQFLASREIQDRTARHFLQQYYNKYGPGGAAVAWYAGEGNARKWVRNGGKGYNGRQTGGPSISAYAYSIMKKMGLA